MYVRELTVSYVTRRDASVPAAFTLPRAAATFAASLIGECAEERVIAFYLDAKHRLLSWQQVGIGGLDRAVVDVRVVWHGALHARATGVIVAHNHPSGDPKMSVEDVLVARKLVLGADTLGLTLLDFLTIGALGAYESLKEKGGL